MNMGKSGYWISIATIFLNMYLCSEVCMPALFLLITAAC